MRMKSPFDRWRLGGGYKGHSASQSELSIKKRYENDLRKKIRKDTSVQALHKMDSYYGQNGSRVYTTKLLGLYRILHGIVVMTLNFRRWAFEIRWSWVRIPSRSIFGWGQIFTLFYAFLKKFFFSKKRVCFQHEQLDSIDFWNFFLQKYIDLISPYILLFKTMS